MAIPHGKGASLSCGAIDADAHATESRDSFGVPNHRIFYTFLISCSTETQEISVIPA
jgi:hypothetical protein